MRVQRPWTVRDLARALGVSTDTAYRMVLRFDEEAGGTLILGTRRPGAPIRFFPSALRKIHPEFFEVVTGLGGRIERLEEKVEEIAVVHGRRLMLAERQVGVLSRAEARRAVR